MLFVGIDIKRYQSGHTHCRDTINKRSGKKSENFYFKAMNIIRGQHHYDNHVVDYYYNQESSLMRNPHKTASLLV